MIGVDTNVLVRYLAQDDPEQSALATAVFERGPHDDRIVLVPLVLAETWWVLSRAYRMAPGAIADIIAGLLTAEEAVVSDEPTVRTALAQVRRGHDFADALIAGTCRANGAEQTLTFDKDASDLDGMSLLT
ncbi:MAG: type II toxin-antitoxin system VapC family toxin [Micrococcales bacterium]|nr:type II toxin-antitoxin system VapC family toxin [Micrococcales bacterium]